MGAIPMGGRASPPTATAGTGAPTPTAGTGTATLAGTGAPSTGGTGAPSTGGTGAVPTGGGGAKPPTTEGGGESSCLDGIEGYGETGPFMYEAKRSGQVNIWVPMVPAGCRVPIVHLNNGTGASCSSYQQVHERFASHGFLALCYENPNTGAGQYGVDAIETAIMEYPDLVSKKIGSTGHSQGGQAAFTTLALAEEKWGLTDYIYAGLAMQPASGFGTQPSGGSWQSVYAKIKSPMFAFSGTADMLVSQGWVQQGFDALDDSIEAYHWSAIGSTHIPTPQEHTNMVGVAWWRWKLLGDQKACAWFKALDGAGEWNEVDSQNAAPCM
jgi:hypothetical protein